MDVCEFGCWMSTPKCFCFPMLRGPVAILFISRDICSDSIAKLSLVLVFVGYRTIIARYVAKWGIAQMCLCQTKYQGGGIALFWGSANLPEKVSRDMGYRSDSIALSRDMGPLSFYAFEGLPEVFELGVSETGSAKTGSAIDVRIDDAGSILKFRIGFSL